jgi:hypothetical protein
MQHEVLQAVTGLGLDDHAELRGSFLGLASASARVAVIIGSGCIWGQFDLRGVACGHGLGGLWVQPNITREAIRPATASHANKGSRSGDEGQKERRRRCLDMPPASSP